MTMYTLRNGATQHPEDSVLQSITDLVYAGGIVGLSDLLVEQQSVADMTVKFATGRAYIKGASSNAYPVRNTASVNVTIPANSSGNPRIDAIVVYIDKSVDASTPGDGSGVVASMCVQGTPAGSPVAPDATAIQAAVGASNPYLLLAHVTVASGASSIVTANISDQRLAFQHLVHALTMKEQSAIPSTPASGYGIQFFDSNGRPAYIGDDGIVRPMGEDGITTLSDGATITIDSSDHAKIYAVTLGGNRTLALSNEYSGRRFMLQLGQDATGSRIPVWFNKATTFATTDVATGTEIITVGRNIPTGTPIKFSTTTTLPSPLVAGTKYYAINNSSTTIKVASSLPNAQAGTAIDLTTQGTGTHTLKTEISWANDTEPVLQTGKHQSDVFGIIVKDATNGIYLGFTLGAGYPNI